MASAPRGRRDDVVDVVVVGEGPAGSALAAACAEAGLSTVHLGVDPTAPWPATYGAWVDEVPHLRGAGDDVWAHRWASPQVAFDDSGPRPLDRAYGLLDNEVLRRSLRERTEAAGGTVRRGRVVGVAHDARGSRVALDAGRDVAATVVVDATGHRGALVDPGRGRAPAHQVAHGVVARVERSPVPDGGMLFMDWRTEGAGTAEPPTFLYAMDLGDGRHFLEETSLAARPPVPMAHLRERLTARLAAAGAVLGPVESTEAVAFPMGGPLPPRDQRVVGFGAAAGMVHPATGYQVAAALRRAPDVALALAEAIGEAIPPAAVAARAWAAVWPDDLVRQRDLHAYGLEVLLGLDAPDIQRFFSAFFALPDERWRAYVSGAASSRELAGVMLAVARRLPPRLRWRVTSGALGADGPTLLRAALRSG